MACERARSQGGVKKKKKGNKPQENRIKGGDRSIGVKFGSLIRVCNSASRRHSSDFGPKPHGATSYPRAPPTQPPLPPTRPVVSASLPGLPFLRAAREAGRDGPRCAGRGARDLPWGAHPGVRLQWGHVLLSNSTSGLATRCPRRHARWRGVPVGLGASGSHCGGRGGDAEEEGALPRLGKMEAPAQAWDAPLPTKGASPGTGGELGT